MLHTYDIISCGNRVSTTTNFEEFETEFFKIIERDKNCWVYGKVTNNVTDDLQYLASDADFEDWREKLEREFQWKPHKKWEPLKEAEIQVKKVTKDAINPSHYKSYISVLNDPESSKVTLQWLEAMQYLPHFKNPDNFKAALELQVRKYLDRSGGKDAELQELKKSLWYLEFLIAYIANGNSPIFIKDIKKLIKG